jgi:hypothetical protein
MFGSGWFEQCDRSLSVACCLVSIQPSTLVFEQEHTKSDVAVAHKTRDVDRLVCSEAGNLAARQEVPGDTGIPSIIAHRKPACTSLARIVDCYPPNILVMSLKPSLDCQSIMVKDEDCVALRIQQI